MLRRRTVLLASLCLLCARAAVAASATSFFIEAPDPSGEEPDSRTQVSFVVADKETDADMQAHLVDVVRDTLRENPGARVEVLCFAEGGGSAPLCRGAEQRLSEAALTGTTTFDAVAVAPPAPPLPPPPPSPSGSPKPPSDWKGVLSIIRLFSGGATVGVTVALTSGDPIAAVTLGTTAGVWGWYWQRNNKPLLDWQASSHLFRLRTPEKAGLPMRLVKRSLYTALYGILMTGGFWLNGLNADPLSVAGATRLAVMVGESLFLQSPWQATNHELRERAIRNHPAREWYYQRLSGVGSLVQSMIAVAQNILNIGGAKMGPWFGATLAAIGMTPGMAERLGSTGAGTVSAALLGTTGWAAWAWVERRALLDSARRVVRAAPGACAQFFHLFAKDPLISWSVAFRLLGNF